MPAPISSRSTTFALIVLALSCAATHAHAQRGERPAQEFTRQGLLIVNFAPGPGADVELGRDAGNAVRSRVDKLLNDREVDVVSRGKIDYEMRRSGYDPDSTVSLVIIPPLGRLVRADEFLLGEVSRAPGRLRLSGELVLLRDQRLRQPLPTAVAPTLDSAVQLFAQSITAARTQLNPQRRCENALRAGQVERALAAAREGVARFPRSTIARTCLIWVLRRMRAPPAQVLSVAQQVLAIDSMSAHAVEAAAIALDSLGRRDEAGTMWLRFANTDTANMDLALRVSYALFDDGNAARAEPFIVRVAHAHPEDIRLIQQQWHIAYANKSWARAIEAAEIMLERDSVARNDSVFYLRLATAYHAAGKPLEAIETATHGVLRFPNDARMYALYSQYIKSEADTVIPRGLARFPHSADLLALNAQELRAKGKNAESLAAMKQAVALDSTMAQGELVIAQLEIDLGRPDSALVALRRAVASGEDSAVVAEFALARGNTLYRAADATRASKDFALALRFLAFADTIRSSQQSRFLLGAAALGVAQAALTEATTLPDTTESCRLARVGAEMLPVARTALTQEQDAFGDAAKQALDYLQQLHPYADQELAAYCPKPPPPMPPP